MPVQSDKWIKKMAIDHKMIEPFEDKQIRGDSISYGVSSYGYDARVGNDDLCANAFHALHDALRYALHMHCMMHILQHALQYA